MTLDIAPIQLQAFLTLLTMLTFHYLRPTEFQIKIFGFDVIKAFAETNEKFLIPFLLGYNVAILVIINSAS